MGKLLALVVQGRQIELSLLRSDMPRRRCRAMSWRRDRLGSSDQTLIGLLRQMFTRPRWHRNLGMQAENSFLKPKFPVIIVIIIAVSTVAPEAKSKPMTLPLVPKYHRPPPPLNIGTPYTLEPIPIPKKATSSEILPPGSSMPVDNDVDERSPTESVSSRTSNYPDAESILLPNYLDMGIPPCPVGSAEVRLENTSDEPLSPTSPAEEAQVSLISASSSESSQAGAPRSTPPIAAPPTPPSRLEPAPASVQAPGSCSVTESESDVETHPHHPPAELAAT